MIQKIRLLTLLLFCIWNVQSQNIVNTYEIVFERNLTFENNPSEPYTSYYEYTKFIELNKSIYNKSSTVEKTNELVEDDNDDSIFYYTPTGKNISVVYKDYKNGEFFYKWEVANKYFVIKDSLTIFNWEIAEGKKEILGYTCQLATMIFRGRTYEAWFTTELPVGGPWKYDGLPGMILELKSTDDFIKFEAIGVKTKLVTLDSLENPFNPKEKMLTWQQFKDLYKKKAIELLNFKPNEYAIGVISSRGGIETYIEENDEEYNEALRKYHKQ
jgi:GLPGLI family protein